MAVSLGNGHGLEGALPRSPVEAEVSYDWHDDFSAYADGEHPAGWRIEEHTARAHRHGCAQQGAYALLACGNKHLPITPPLRDVVLTFDCHGDPGVTEAVVFVFFRYQPETGTGYFIKHGWTRAAALTDFGVIQGHVPHILATRAVESGFAADPAGADNHIRLEACGDSVAVYHNGVAAGVFKDTSRTLEGAGHIAFDRGRDRAAGRGVLWLKHVRIQSSDAVERRVVWAPVSVRFPPDYNGMVSPYRFHLQASALPGCVEVTARLTGGPAERRDPTFEGYKKAQRWMNELLSGPYVRLETGAGRPLGTFYLHRGTVGLNARWDRQATALPPAQAECPIERTFMLPALPPDTRLFFGYDYYEAEERQVLKGGPTEVMVDPATGAVVYGGPALLTRLYHLELRSGAGTGIGARLPPDDPRYAEARAFADGNHYFYEGEPVVFSASAHCRKAGSEPPPVTLSTRLLDVFFQPMEEWREVPFSGGPDARSDGFGRMGFDTRSAVLDWGRRPVGVYHAALRLQRAEATVASLVRAFEVMPEAADAVPAPLASGLPELVCAEYFEYLSPTSAFDPWVGRAVDEYHYVSHAVFDATFARRNKIPRVVKAYRRRLLAWLFPWMPDGADPESWKEWLAQVDVIYSAGLLLRFDLWRRGLYARGKDIKGPPNTVPCRPRVFDCFLEFLRSPAVSNAQPGGLSADTVEARGKLTEQEFAELVERHWKPWLEWFNRWYSDTYAPAERARMQALAPHAQWGGFGPYPPYGSIYKSTYFARLMGRDLTRGWHTAWRGPLRFESYPCVCGYPVQRDVFVLASMKLEAPDMRLYPEVYGLVACPVDGHVMNGSPPYGRHRADARSFPKRFFEYAYAAVWFDGAGFRFWQDNGFQPTHWAREHFAALLSAWSTIRAVRPLKPARTTAFVYSRTACINHPDYHERRAPSYAGSPVMPDDVFNTAEECIAFAYEQARVDGQSAGFVTELRHLCHLAPGDVDTLVLPPFSGLSDADLGMIRRCHEAGMNLMAFEEVAGLEDLFGVAPAGAVAVGEIAVAREYRDVKPWCEVADVRERTAHPLCRVRYREHGCRAVLTGLSATGARVPVLTLHQTASGKTALFTLPPTVVHREDGGCVHTYGSASMSRLMNRAMALVLRHLGSPAADTTAGKLMAFWDTRGALRIIVEEDAAPESAAPIEPMVTVRLGRAIRDIECAPSGTVVTRDGGTARVRVRLEPHECALLTVR